FDASTLELWGALLNGARLALMPPGVPSLEELGRALRRHNVTTLWLTAGLFHLMVDERAEDLGGLRQLLAGGDVLSPEHVRRFLEAAPASTLINGYGPTENTTFTCCHPMRGSFDATRSVPLGRPVANTSVYVLDRRMRPVVLGSVGELYTGGDGLARGYLNRPELTAERFVPDPFSTEPGARLYRTGDLVRWLPDGTLEFLGRADHQVKIRGFRIELGEIEAALARHESVREASVVALDGAGGGKRLVAYVVGSETQPAAAELRDFLTARLPEYMVPSAFVALDALPLTPNGTVDRKRLPAPDERGDEREGPFVAARTPVEEMLASVWSEVLGVELVGASDDFFALGGQSLLATQMVSRVRELFRVELPLRAVFEAPTLAQLAARVADLQRTSAGSVTPPVTRVARDSELPLSYPQQRLWFLDQLEPDSPFYNVPTAVRMTGRLDAAALEESLRQVVRRHESLRTSFAVVEGRPVQVINEDAPVSLPVIDISHLSFDEREREARRLAREESRRPFSLTCAPLMRAVLVRLSEDEHVIVLTMHHIVSDGWSMEVLVREMSALYEAFSEGKPSPLAELPIQYADFAAWQRNWLQGEVLEAHLDYWKKRLAGTSGVLELRTDRPRPAAQTFRGAMRRVELPADLSEQINDFSRRENVTPFMTMLAAFNVLLRRESGQDDIVVGCNIANRNRGETESLIGFFVNMLPVRSDLSGQPTFGELLRRTREAAFGAYAHQDLPFDKLVAEVLPERDPSRMPLVQVVFNFQNGATAAPRVAGLALDFLDTGSPSATFDMTMHVENTPQGVRGELLYSTDLFDEA
ncbi:MAG TPA: condensation domain-containing protein, partial [Pyrinomonadaceae bacterium]|nr:condensation domain-containing protein [Pyrinomonadaceae bacterium]